MHSTQPNRSHRWAFRALPAFAAVLGCLAVPAPSSAQAGLSFYTVAPCRVLDTRTATGPFGAPGIPTGGIRSFTVAGRCGVPTSARAVSMNVTVIAPPQSGYLVLYPAGVAQPLASTINYRAATTRANNAVLGLGDTGGLTIFADGVGAAVIAVVLDVTGYFEDPATAGATVAPPVFVPPPGIYTEPQQVTIATSTTDSTIRYTTDGSLPSPSSGLVYTGAVMLQSGTTLRAIAVNAGIAPSSVATAVYNFQGQPTLYLATLVPEGAAISTAHGNSTLLLAPDQASAAIRFSHANLSSTLIGGHLHGPANPGQSGQILFDLDTSPVQADGSLLWTFTQVGTTTPADIAAAIQAGRIYINLHTANSPSGEIRGHYNLANGSTSFTPPPAPPPLPGGPLTLENAARFLAQASYGPKMSEIQALPGQGFDSWLAAQFALPQVSHLGYLDAALGRGEELSDHQASEAIWTQVIAGNDHLRARMALALSEILVVSGNNDFLASEPDTLAGYMDVLNRNAFDNFRQALEEIALSTAMGIYLDMLRNDKPDAETGQNPNENFAREILQLFTIGLYQLHPDGTLKLDLNGLPIATYNQNVVVGFAHVFTGWSLGGNDTTDFWEFYWPPVQNFRLPMAAWPEHHSLYPKRLLDGTLLPPAAAAVPGLAELELDLALDNIFNHPNVGPFLARQLIQRLVTSNPSPGYIYRVASAFNDNGAGVRGDLQAVLRAILLDYEARSTTLLAFQGYGKQREPIVRFGGLLRALDATAPSGFFRIFHIESPEFGLGQNALHAPTVFNFFEPSYSLPGEIATAGLDSPEFQITNETSAIGIANFFLETIYRGFQYDQDEITLNLTSLTPLAGDPTALVDHLDLLLMSGQMTDAMRTIVVSAVNGLSATPPEERVRAALRLIATSPEYAIQK